MTSEVTVKVPRQLAHLPAPALESLAAELLDRMADGLTRPGSWEASTFAGVLDLWRDEHQIGNKPDPDAPWRVIPVSVCQSCDGSGCCSRCFDNPGCCTECEDEGCEECDEGACPDCDGTGDCPDCSSGGEK